MIHGSCHSHSMSARVARPAALLARARAGSLARGVGSHTGGSSCSGERAHRPRVRGARRRERATAEERWLNWCTSRLKERRFADPPDFLSFELVRVGPTPLIFWLSGWYGWVRPP